MGNKQSSQQSSTPVNKVLCKRAAAEWKTWKKLQADVAIVNSFSTLRLKHHALKFSLVVKKSVPDEFLPVVWQFANNTRVKIVIVPKTTKSSLGARGTVFQGFISIAQFYKAFVLLLELKGIPLLPKNSGEATPQECSTSAATVSKSVEDELTVENECVICMGKKKEIVLGCSHGFCQDCFTAWRSRQSSCPFCRKEMPEDAESEDIWSLEKSASDEFQTRFERLEEMVMNILCVQLVEPGEKTKKSDDARGGGGG